MDPNSGEIYESMQAAKDSGVKNPVEVFGRRQDVERMSSLISKGNRAERREAARRNRKRNDGSSKDYQKEKDNGPRR